MADLSSLTETAIPNGRDKQIALILFECPSKSEGFSRISVNIDELSKTSLFKKYKNKLKKKIHLAKNLKEKNF